MKRLVLILVLLWPASAHALTIDLATGSTVRMTGASTVADAGDVNGDGIGDTIVGQATAGAGAGAAWVVYGGGPATLNLANALPAAQGFKITGLAGGGAGAAVAGAGDVNGDGYADVIVGAPGTDANGTDSGAAYVVYGAPSQGLLALGTLTTDRGVAIGGQDLGDHAGAAVDGAGDVNGDGYPDVIVGAPLDDNNAKPARGRPTSCTAGRRSRASCSAHWPTRRASASTGPSAAATRPAPRSPARATSTATGSPT